MTKEITSQHISMNVDQLGFKLMTSEFTVGCATDRALEPVYKIGANLFKYLVMCQKMLDESITLIRWTSKEV